MSSLNLSLLREIYRNVKGTQPIISDLWKNIIGRVMFTISTEVITSQEINMLQQRKYRLDRRKNWLIVSTVRCRECVFKAGYETSIITDFKNRRNSAQSKSKSLDAEGCIKLVLLPSHPGWAVPLGTLSLTLSPFFLFIYPSHLHCLFAYYKLICFTLIIFFKCKMPSRFPFLEKICCLEGTTFWWYQDENRKQEEIKPSVYFLSWFLTKPLTMLETPHSTFLKGISYFLCSLPIALFFPLPQV